ncbi:hypothetical protein NMU03_13960 [Allocoprobacillus halotolerans]|uniref:Uncharacterized protein n=1 Tax=Allocoprobacillus halotolerans TaxID=2944914 RepID=A0ABY5I3T0_9FIRM|nr:hypothetical protein [Allocoprobacillus halotolerans]UTY38698.1 hypothetical protein NMU03_13960 [Allocoprobacillus halotolerans]
MNIEVKGINGILVMKVQENCSFHQFLEDLNQLLGQSLFLQEGYYPRAFLILVVEFCLMMKWSNFYFY